MQTKKDVKSIKFFTTCFGIFLNIKANSRMLVAN